MNMEKHKFEFDTEANTYTLDGKDIAHKLTGLEIKLTGHERKMTLTYDKPFIKFSGALIGGSDDVLKPAICDCGFKIAEYSIDIDCICPNCKKHIIVSAGQLLSY